jgi:LmbE family N-acetylglucosaminyl deacetylase
MGLPDCELVYLYEHSPEDGSGLWMPNPGTDNVCFPWAYMPGLAFNRQAIIQALRHLIESEMPTDILIPRPDERHLEHAITYHYVMDAVEQIEREHACRFGIHVNKMYGQVANPPLALDLEEENLVVPTHRELVKFFQSALLFQLPFKRLDLRVRATDRQNLRNHPAYTHSQWFRLRRGEASG